MTNEPIELVAPWLEAHSVTHPVVILPGGQLENVIGVKGFPTSAVFLGKEMQWTGHPASSSSALAKVQKGAKKTSVYPKALSKVFKSLKKGDLVKAMLDLQTLQEKLEGEDAAWAGRLEISLMGQCAKAFTSCSEFIEQGFWYKGMELAQPYLGKGSPYSSVAETRALLESLQEKDLYSKELAGGELYLKAQNFERSKEYSDAVKTYISITKKCADSQIAGHALSAAQQLIDERRPGYKDSCEICRKNKGAACSKHLEQIKL